MTRTDFNNAVSSLNNKVAGNKTKNDWKRVLKVTNIWFKLFIDKSHFEEDGTQNYLVFQQINRYFQAIVNTDYVSLWKFKGLFAETIEPPTTSDNSLTPTLKYYGTKKRVKFAGSCLKQPNISYTHGKTVNIYNVYELGASSCHNNDPTLKNCLFGAVTLTKNADINKYGYSGHGIGFDRRSSFSFPGGWFGRNVLIFEADMSSSAHINNKKNDILLFGKRTNTRLRTHTGYRKNVFN